MEGTFLITSAAYSSPDFISTFGLLPPSFLPVGNKRLYEIQAHLITELGCNKFLSLPDGFEFSKREAVFIESIGLTVIRVPLGLSLGASIANVLKQLKLNDGALRILHGDTLLFDFPLSKLDVVSEGVTNEYYTWAESEQQPDQKILFTDGLPKGRAIHLPDGNREVLSGYFSFSNARLYQKCLKIADENFIESLNHYAKKHHLSKIVEGKWLDFGHLSQYYQSKAFVTTERDFNQITISRRSVKKSSSDKNKIKAEISWYSNLPDPLKIFVPQFMGTFSTSSEEGYETEYLYLSTLHELEVFGRLPSFVWQRIFQSCDDFLTAAKAFKPKKMPKTPENIYLEKTMERLEKYSGQTGTELKKEWIYNDKLLPSLEVIAETTADLIPKASLDQFQIIHGDLCFSNILYDFRANMVRVIDPRGVMADGTHSIYGDLRYDIAKLYQSVVGGYEYIICGHYRLEDTQHYNLSLWLPSGSNKNENQEIFQEKTFAGLNSETAFSKHITILLFLSMLPLHKDQIERQRAFLANALRLYSNLDS